MVAVWQAEVVGLGAQNKPGTYRTGQKPGATHIMGSYACNGRETQDIQGRELSL
jgi:hypothetical protein